MKIEHSLPTVIEAEAIEDDRPVSDSTTSKDSDETKRGSELGGTATRSAQSKNPNVQSEISDVRSTLFDAIENAVVVDQESLRVAMHDGKPASQAKVEDLHPAGATERDDMTTPVSHEAGSFLVQFDVDDARGLFPGLAQYTSDEARGIFEAASSVIKEGQTKQEVVNTPIATSDSPPSIEQAYEPFGYNRALVISAPVGDQNYLFELKGAGTQTPRQRSHGNGLMTLAEGLRERSYEKMIRMLLGHAGVDVGTVPIFGTAASDFHVVHADGSKSRAGKALRGPYNRKQTSATSEYSNFLVPMPMMKRVEQLYRLYGVTTAGEDFQGERGGWMPINVQGTESGDIMDFGHYLVQDGAYPRKQTRIPHMDERRGTVMRPEDRDFVDRPLEALQIPYADWGRPIERGQWEPLYDTFANIAEETDPKVMSQRANEFHNEILGRARDHLNSGGQTLLDSLLRNADSLPTWAHYAIEGIYTDLPLRPGMQERMVQLFEQTSNKDSANTLFRILAGRQLLGRSEAQVDLEKMIGSMQERFDTSDADIVTTLAEVSLDPELRDKASFAPPLGIELTSPTLADDLFVAAATQILVTPEGKSSDHAYLMAPPERLLRNLGALLANDRIERKVLGQLLNQLDGQELPPAALEALSTTLLAGTKPDALSYYALKFMSDADSVPPQAREAVRAYDAQMKSIGGYDKLATYRGPAEKILDAA